MTKTALAILAASAFLISGALTVQFVLSVQPGITAIACGLTFHGMQYGLAIAARSLQAHSIAKLATWALSLAFLALSLCASVAFLETGYQAKHAAAESRAHEQTRAEQLGAINAARIENAQRFTGLNHLSKSAAELDKAEAALSRSDPPKPEPKNGAPALLALVASATGTAEQSTRLFAFLVIAALLDLSGMLTIFYLFQPAKPAETGNFTQISQPESLKPALSEPEKLAARIASGEFGEKPKGTDIAKETGVSPATVSRAMRLLRTETQPETNRAA